MGGYADFAAYPSAEKPAQNDLKLNDPKGGRARARTNRPATEVAEPVHAPHPQSPRPEPHPAPAPAAPPAQPSIAAPAAGGDEASLVSELGAVTTALAQVAAQLATALAAHPTAAPLPAPAPVAAPAVAALPAIATAPDPARPDTWKCARHLAAPDPQDRPCGCCGAVRKHHEALRDLQVTEAAQKRSEAAQRARGERDACPDCDDYGHVLDPDTGQVYDHPLRCEHTGPATERIARHRQHLLALAAQTAQAEGTVPGEAARAQIRAHLTAQATRRTETHHHHPGRALPPTPKAWR